MKRKKYNIKPYLFITPHIVLFLMFFLMPAVFGIYISFTKWNLFSSPEWVGFENYIEILFNRESTFYFQLRNGLANTIKFVLMSVPFCILVPLFIAVSLNTKTFGRKVFQLIFYVPSLLSISSVVLAWYYMFHRSLGPINNVLNIKVNWFGEQPYTWSAIVIITVWWCIGANMVIYMSALASIRKDLYEASAIDGAGVIKQFWHVTLPGMINPLAYTIVLTTIAQFNIYGQPLMFSKGGPKDSTRVMLMYIREHAFGTGGSLAGIASAMSVMLGLCILVVSIFQFVFIRKEQ